MKNALIIPVKFLLLLLSFSIYPSSNAAELNARVDYNTVFLLTVGITGEVRTVNVSDGDLVKAGQILLEMDNRYLKTQIEASTAQLDFFRAEMEEAERAYARDEILFEEGSLSTVELELSNIARLESISNFKRSQALLEQHQFQLRQSVITAPVDGIILKRHARIGERVFVEHDSHPAFLFASKGKIVRAEVSSSDAFRFTIGKSIDMKINNQILEGEIKSIDSVTKPGTSYLSISTKQPLPKVGQPVTISY